MTLAEELMSRMRQDELPPRERLEELLDFDPEKGTFHWKVDVGRRQAGDPAGAVLPDRHCITIDGRNYQARRIAWFLIHGEIPKTRLYAKNGDMTDHRADNITDDKTQASTLPPPETPLVSATPDLKPAKGKKPQKPRIKKVRNAPAQTKAPKQSNIVPKLDRQTIQQQIQTTNASNIARLMANPRVASGELERVLLEKALDDGDMAAMKLILSRTHSERTMGDTKLRDTTPVRINITTFNPDQPEENKTVQTVINGEWQNVEEEDE